MYDDIRISVSCITVVRVLATSPDERNMNVENSLAIFGSHVINMVDGCVFVSE